MLHRIKPGLCVLFLLPLTFLSGQDVLSLKSKNISFFEGDNPGENKVELSPSTEEVINLVDQMVELGKASRTFRILAAPVVSVVALEEDAQTYLLYEPSFLDDGSTPMEKNWTRLGVLAHQIGHLAKFHSMDRKTLPEEVLKAERFAAFVLYRMGATLEQAQGAIKTYAPAEATKTHPGREARLEAFTDAFVEARQQGKVSNNSAACPGFAEAPDPDKALELYVLYRDNMKIQQYDVAFDYWKQVYEVAPAADGRRNTILTDGIQLYQHFYQQAADSLEREKFIDQIFELYDRIEACYPEGGGYASGRKAFDLYYQYLWRASRREIYDLFKKSIDQDRLNTNFFVLNPFSALLVEMYGTGEIDAQEARTYQQKVREILAKGLEECEGEGCEPWLIIQEYTPPRLEAFEAVRDFYGYEYYLDKYFPEFLADSTDCETVTTVYSRLVWGKIPADHPKFQRIVAARKNACIAPSTQLVREAYDCLQNADYDCAIEKFESAAGETDDPEKQGTYMLLVSKIYQAHKKNFSKSREYALKAAEIRPDWGDPYIQIGILYASSGPLCGPGRGWDSQIVTWPAIDKWNKAKQVDPSVSEEANRLIGRYRQYMPAIGDIFQRTLKEGERFFVPCWIQEWTTIRAAR